MKGWAVALIWLGLVVWPGGEAAGEKGSEQARRDHALLLKKPQSAMALERFVGSWLDTGSRDGLMEFLVRSAREGEAANWWVLASFLEREGRDEEALGALDTAVEMSPGDSSVLLARARIQARLLNFEAALADLEEAGPVAAEGEQASLRGLYLVRSGRPAEAVAAWKQALVVRPSDEELHEDLIELELAEGLSEEALEATRSLLAITQNPDQKALRQLMQGDILLLLGRREEALAVFQAVLESTGDGSWLEREVLAQVEQAFEREEDPDGFWDFYTRSREGFPARIGLPKLFATQLALRGEVDEAVTLFREVLESDPGDRHARGELIDLLEGAGLLEEAGRELEALIGDKGELALFERLADLRHRMGDRSGLEEALGRMLTRANQEGDSAALVLVARLFERYELPGRSEQVLRDACRKFAGNVELKEAWASCLASRERPEEALVIWEAMAVDADRDGLLAVSRSLRVHGFAEEAFNALQRRAPDFGRDAVFLSAYCEAGVLARRGGEVWSSAVLLARLAETPADLEQALGQALMVARQGDVEGLVDELERGESPGERCLRAELLGQLGFEAEALEMLAAMEKREDGEAKMLLADRRVRLLERHGEFAGALEVVRSLIAQPNGQHPGNLRRLVDLLVREGRMEEALQVTGQWTGIAPGDHRAWRRRAELLRELGRSEEAGRELRRAVGSFGPGDEEGNSILASFLAEAGELREAEMIYRRLYEEAEGWEAKERWMDARVDLARRRGRHDELAEEFERRKRANPREVGPLLALAACYSGVGDFQGEQEALLGASRRDPDDLHVITRLAAAAERNGDHAAALRWRRKAVQLDDSPVAARRLAEFYFRQGEMELGLDRLAGGGAGLPGARDVERMLQNLARSKEWGPLLDYLATRGGLVMRDWRLRYLQGVALAEDGRGAEARAIFDGLLEPRAGLPGLKPLLSREQLQAMGSTPSETVAAEWDFYGAEAFDHELQNRAVALPGTVRELRWMALRQLLVLMEAGEEEEAGLDARLEGLGWQEARLLLMPSADVLDYYHAELEVRPDDPELLAQAVEWTAGEEELDLRWLERAATELRGRWKRQGEAARLALVLRKANRAENPQAALLASLDRADARTRQWILEWFGQNAFNDEGGDVEEGQRIEVARHLSRHLLAVPSDYWQDHWWWVGQFLHYQFEGENIREGITLLNRIALDLKSRPIEAAWGGGGLSPSGNLVVPPFPARGTEHATVLLSALSEEEGDALAPRLTERQATLLRELGYAPGPGNRELDLDALSGHLRSVEDDYLRLVLWQLCGKPEQIEAELAVLVKRGDFTALLTAAGYAGARGRMVDCYQQLVKARDLFMERARRSELDGHLVAVAAAVFEQGRGDEIDPEPARRAALRLRRSFRDPDEVSELASLMETIGLDKERIRLLRPRTTRVRMGGPSRFTPREEVTPALIVRNLILRDERDKVVLTAARELRKAFGSGHSEDEEIVDLVKEAGFEEKVLSQLDPGEARGLSQRQIYWQACVAFDRPGRALPVLRSLVGDRPGDQELRRQLIALLPPEEQGGLLREAVEAGDVEEVAALYAVVAEQAEDQGEEAMFRSLDLLAEILEQLEPSGEAVRDLSFALHYARRAFEPWEGAASLPGIARLQRFPPGKLASQDPGIRGEVARAQARWIRRTKGAERVGRAALRHPQLALPLFRLLHGHRRGLERENADFVDEARMALVAASEWVTEGRQRLDPWSSYTDLLGPPRHLGMAAATYLAHLACNDEKIPGGWGELVLKSDPGRPRLLQLIMATAAGDRAGVLKAANEWAGGLPEDVGWRAMEVAELLECYLVLVPEEDEVMKIVMGVMEDPELVLTLAEEHAAQCHDLLRWGKRCRGRAGVHALLVRFTGAAIGDREIWAACAELAADDVLPHELDEYMDPFRKLMKVILEGGAVSLDTLAFLHDNGLIPLAKMEDHRVMRGVGWQLHRATVEEVVGEFEAAGLWSDESYRLWAAVLGRNLETFYEQLPSCVKVGNLDRFGSCRALGRTLMMAKGENAFLKRLVGARLVDDDDTRAFVVTQLAKHAPSLRKLPEDTLQHLAVLVRLWIPEMSIPRADRETTALLEVLSR